MKLKIVFFFLLVSCGALAAERYALIIAVGDYPVESGWAKINSVNDVPLIKNALLVQDFKPENIQIIKDQDATKKAIMDALASLKERVRPGDIVVIHYSGHGQQIFDDNGDEADGKDEALIPYDAYSTYSEGYKGENHFRDDVMGQVITGFRNALGAEGQLLILLDSCHSGSSTRAGGVARGGEAVFAPQGWNPGKNGAGQGSDMMDVERIKEDASPFVMITGASADELNYEYEGVGSLSYSFNKAMSELGNDFTYRQLYAKIAANMNVISPKQTPTLEGNADYKLFKGEYVAQQPYYAVKKVARPDVLEIDAGKLQGLYEGTTVFVMPAGSVAPTKEGALATGKVINPKFNEAIIKLDNGVNTTNEADLWVFINEQAYGDISLNVYFDEAIEPPIDNAILSILSEKNMGKAVEDSLMADVIISQKENNLILSAAKGRLKIEEIPLTRVTQDPESFFQGMFTYAQGQYLKNLTLDNYEYEFEFKLVPIEYDLDFGYAGDFLPEGSNINDKGIYEVNTSSDFAVVKVTNLSVRPLYITLIEINSKGYIRSFLPNDDCDLSNGDRKIPPGQTVIFKDCVFSFGPPYERLMLKGFASDEPINFQATVETRGESTRAGSTNPLEQFIGETYSQTRGGTGNKVHGKIDGYSTEFIYEIVK
ncbi:MAG: peptidase C14 [Cytophagaceae bacterium]|nr:peptidase C14 [Cytophagaceae bacterium]|tara:strand:+ start:1646 stop:3610 length:1965 start_codon:yes stop_codon:yes gene_type:complete